MSAAFTRAQLLRERGRHEEAVAILLSHLAHHPEDPAAFIELALNRMEIPGQMKLALGDARSATGLLPGLAFPLALQSRILTHLNKAKEALALAESAIALEPDSDYAWNSKCVALIDLTRWKDAEEAARKALEIDPDDEMGSNLLAHVLRMQNRLDESEEESSRRLARDPENAFSFATAGWAALQRGDIKGAEEKFRESLRIDPEMGYAREGLKESFRARSAFFRLFLKWSFFLQKFSESNRTLIIISLIIGFRVLRTLAAGIHPLLVVLVVFAYYLFVFGSWLSSGLANFFLLRDPVARMSLDRMEKIEGMAIAALFFGGTSSVLVGFTMPMMPLAAAGCALLAAAIPASMVFTNPSRKGTAVFALITAAIFIAGAGLTAEVIAHPENGLMKHRAGNLFTTMIVLCAGASWLGMARSLRTRG
ncbi:tetratricopeptide repeat protein [Akkermansiaceae bacterium]|nr:tetratricopeptide repeat protein [Akkermansiaceae bacterium]